MNRTSPAINYKLIVTSGDIEAFKPLLEQAISNAVSMFESFNFKDKIEVIVFFSERQDFKNYIFKEYEDKDIDGVYESENVVHIIHGIRSIIGIKVVSHSFTDTRQESGSIAGDSLESLLTQSLALTIEHFKQLVSSVRLPDLENHAGYKTWELFFSEAHVSRWKQTKNESNDCNLLALLTLLEDGERAFRLEERAESLRIGISSMGDLYFHKKNNHSPVIDTFLQKVEETTGIEVRTFYEQLFMELADYMDSIGVKYNSIHNMEFFERIEQIKSTFATQLTKQLNPV